MLSVAFCLVWDRAACSVQSPAETRLTSVSAPGPFLSPLPTILWWHRGCLCSAASFCGSSWDQTWVPMLGWQALSPQLLAILPERKKVWGTFEALGLDFLAYFEVFGTGFSVIWGRRDNAEKTTFIHDAVFISLFLSEPPSPAGALLFPGFAGLCWAVVIFPFTLCFIQSFILQYS